VVRHKEEKLDMFKVRYLLKDGIMHCEIPHAVHSVFAFGTLPAICTVDEPFFKLLLFSTLILIISKPRNKLLIYLKRPSTVLLKVSSTKLNANQQHWISI